MNYNNYKKNSLKLMMKQYIKDFRLYEFKMIIRKIVHDRLQNH
jgi:hypothetical protein